MNQPLQDWFSETYLDHHRNDDLIYNNAAEEQIMFVRDVIDRLLNSHQTYEFLKTHPVEVIGTHISKSCPLPVYRIRVYVRDDDTSKYLEVIMRNNFYDWKVTVRSPFEIHINARNLSKLFKPDGVIHEVYCEGFQSEDVLGAYSDDQSAFTCEIHSKYDLYTFFWLVVNNASYKI